MGRKSLAEQLIEKYIEEPPGDETLLVVYDFQDVKPVTKFYDNINRVKTLTGDGQLIQYSVYLTKDQRGAKTIRDLVHHYGGQVFIFRGEPTELE